MNEERLGSTGAFVDALTAHLARIEEGGPPLPDAEELARLVEVGFFAGLHEEEARRTTLTLTWTSEVPRCAAMIALASPVLATPKTLAKLAPAAQQAGSSLAVRAEGDRLVVWALLQHVHGRDLPLTLSSLAPGVLRVDYLGQPRALYARGETLFLDGGHEVRSPALRLTEAFASWRGSADAEGVDPRAAAVTSLAARALSHGHGGMILLLPEGAEPRGVRVHYAVGEGADLLVRRRARLAQGDERAGALLEDGLDFVAGFTGTDNALLLDTELRVRGFGVQVIEGEAPLVPFAHVSPYTGSSHFDDISTFKGTRHPAGVIFCLRQEGEAAAIIASQDGRLSLVTKDANGAVEVLGSYERAFGWR